MVFTNKYAEDLIKRFPGFETSKELEEALELFGDEGNELNAHGVMSGFTEYVINIINNNLEITNEEKVIFQYIEECRKKFHEYEERTVQGSFDNAICTCFLENLINSAGWGRFDFLRIAPLLGEKSIEYCKYWDEFTGVRSPGIWTDEEWEAVIKDR